MSTTGQKRAAQVRADALYETWETANIAAQLNFLDTGLPTRAVRSSREFGMWVIV